MAKDEFTAKELKEARERIAAERESSVLISRTQRLANAVAAADAEATAPAPLSVGAKGGR